MRNKEQKCIDYLDKKGFTNVPIARLPKKEWDYLSEEGFLTKEQVKFLKKAEKLGYEVDIRPRGLNSTNFMRGNFSWAETEVVISTTLKNEIE